jgi:hypothetical protein
VEKEGRDRQAADDNIKRRICFACWIPKATETHSECVIFIVFPLQRRLREGSPILRCTYIACLISVMLELNFVILFILILGLQEFLYLYL